MPIIPSSCWMSSPANDPEAASSGFFLLPLEIRNMIYDLLIQGSTIDKNDPEYISRNSDPVPPPPHGSRFHRLQASLILPLPDLTIKTNKVRFATLKHPSNLMTANHQTHDELSSRIFRVFQHVQLTGDFLLGLQSTKSIFNLLQKRPWISTYTKSITISLKLPGFIDMFGGLAVNTSVLDDHPWLYPRLRIAELNVRTFELAKKTWIQSCMTRLKYGKYDILSLLSNLGIWKPRSDEHNTLPDLAKLFETCPQLKQIDIETEFQSLLSLFPASTETAASFEGLGRKGVEVCLLLWDWQIESFSNMMMKHGVERGQIQFSERSGKGEIYLDFERDVRTGNLRDRVVRYRLLDTVLRPEEEVMRDRKRMEAMTNGQDPEATDDWTGRLH